VTVIATGLSSARKAAATPPLAVVSSPVQAVPPTLQPQRMTGTDNLPVLNQPVHVSPQQHDYTGLNTPSVWRTGRTAAAKVDALASNGMDEIEIPAFLRKQAD
jgi:cell division protein FtsZ